LWSISLVSNDSFVTGDEIGSIQIWSSSSFSFQNEITLREHNDSVSDLAFLNNGFLVSTSFDRTIKIWDNSLRLWSSVNNSHSKDVLALRVKNESVLMSSSLDGTVHFWNTDHFILNKTIYVH